MSRKSKKIHVSETSRRQIEQDRDGSRYEERDNQKVAGRLTENYRTEELFMPKNGRQLPDRSKVIDILRELKNVVFPGYFGKDSTMELDASYYAGYRLNHLYDALRDRLRSRLSTREMRRQMKKSKTVQNK